MTATAYAEYATIEAVNWSSLKLIGRSPAHYRYSLMHPREETDPLKIGQATHLATYEPERFPHEVAKWDGGTRRGKVWDAFVDAHEGQIILTESEYEIVTSMATAARTDEKSKKYITGGRGEQTIQWTHEHERTKIACKARLDFIAEVEAIVDMKTTVNAEPSAFGRQAYRLAYHGQAAFYSDGYFAKFGKRLPYILVAVEKNPPWAVMVYRVTDKQLQMGREMYTDYLDVLVQCREKSDWPGYGTEMDLEFPEWVTGDDMADLGLHESGDEE